VQIYSGTFFMAHGVLMIMIILMINDAAAVMRQRYWDGERSMSDRKDACFARNTRWELRALAAWTTFDVCVFWTVRCRWSPSSSACRSCTVPRPPPSTAPAPAWSSERFSVLCPASQTYHTIIPPMCTQRQNVWHYLFFSFLFFVFIVFILFFFAAS